MPARGVLVRVGIDATAGGWNAPYDPRTGEFVYVPIPESDPRGVRPGYGRAFVQVEPALGRLGVALPDRLRKCPMHLDPDFAYLTYGDCWPRSKPLLDLGTGDFLAFYAGLRALGSRRGDALVYALIGFYRVHEVVDAQSVPRERWDENAHTRRRDPGREVIVRAVPGSSGRLARAIPVGEYRDRAYRVRRPILRQWGGLSVRNGYLQRSGRMPEFLDGDAFLAWFRGQGVELVQRNN